MATIRTKAELNGKINDINDALGVKVLRLEYTSGRPRLMRVFTSFERELTPIMTKNQMFNYLDAFLLGTHMARATGIWSHGK